MNKAAADGGSSNNLKQTTMASNEEILEKRIIVFPSEDDMTDEAIKRNVYKAMDAARREEVIEILKWLTSENSPYAVCYGSDTPFATIDDDYTIEQFYTIFKNRNS